MKSAWPLAVAVLLLASGFLLAEMISQPSAVATEDLASQTELSALRNQVRTLADENRLLEDRMAALELKSELPPIMAPAAAPLQLVAPAIENPQSEEVAALLAAYEDPEQTPEGLETVILGVVQAQEEREREERDARREEEWQERLDEQMQEYAEKLGLNGYQATEMRTALDDQRTASSDLWQQRRDGGMGRTDMRDAFGEIRENTQTTLQGLLLPNQYEQYETMQDDRGGGWGRGGGGDR
jgi:hypothetical protein